MTIIEFLNRRDINLIVYKMVRNGLMDYSIIRDIEITNNYKAMNDNLSKQIKYELLSDEYELSSERIKQIILKLTKDII